MAAPHSRFDKVPQAPEDAILGVTIAYNNDKTDTKLNLGVGAYRTEDGKPLVLNVVRKVEEILLKENHEYLAIDGLPEFRNLTAKLIFGEDSKLLQEGKVATVQSLSGTGALRVGAAFVEKWLPDVSVYLPTPTWGNHMNIFTHARVPHKKYRYFSNSIRGLDLEGMLADLQAAADGSIVLLHACAHNPTGCDPTRDQWQRIADVMKSKGHLPFFDSAYQGFASGDLDHDAWAVRHFADRGFELIVSQSYAKNMGLYGERIGALNIVVNNAEEAEKVRSQLKVLIRPMYSNPPAHGARIVAAVLRDPALRAEWKQELKAMADRIMTMRSSLRDELKRLGTPGDWSHIVSQIGMFSFTGLSEIQVEAMTAKHHVYMTKDGRISMAGLSSRTVPHLAHAIDDVVRNVS
eukprot:CAMPEP_0196654420 /NCGR_PEP_ID=MMETSP1086-20130531/4118_1 /TAXON_ID=77921 /ORGANISM="Cyanoptyche  gloeocystis , Strain SAG4.97" /LENGTH=405 /DNA_ID=CAMNT_0041986165 /DNA_START=66 /DNA_END=1283 /DNA_ORIENTATION=+